MKLRKTGAALLLSGLIACVAVSAYAQGNATTYYVSTTGSDGADGLTTETPFATIGKAASLMQAGDRCLIRRGIYRETVTPANSGSSGAPITFEAYENEAVYVSGADPVTGWTQHEGNIYKAQMAWDLGKYENQILVNGRMAWMARTPNVDDEYTPNPYLLWCGGGFGVVDRRRWHTLAEPVATSQRVCIGATNDQGYGQVGSSYDHAVSDDGNANYRLPPELFNRPANFFQGGLLTIQAGYWMGSGLISGSQSTSSRTEFTAGRINPMSQENGGGPGWVSHLFELLDAPNEWYRDDNGTVYLWAPDGADPSGHLVEAKARVLGFDLTGKQNIVVRKLRFIAASMTLKDAQNCLVEECQFKYVTHDDVPSTAEMGVYFEIDQNVGDGHLGIYLGGTNNVLSRCMVRGSAHSGVVIGGKYCTVSNCHITSCDYSITYHAGVLIIPDGPDWSDANRPIGAVICSTYFAYNNRASIQVGCHANATSDPRDRIRIMHNEFGTAGYTSETGLVAMQSSQGGELAYNRFHDAAFVDVGSTCLEEDFGAQNWVVHHNVFYQGDSSVVMAEGGDVVLRCCDFTFSGFGGSNSMCFNNTIVDSADPSHKDWQTMTGFDGTPWDTPIRHNNLWAMGDTVPWNFADPDNRGYALSGSSPAIDAGEIVPGWVEDFEGAAPDLGAYEYGLEPWRAGPTWPEQSNWQYPPGDSPIDVGLDPRTRYVAGPLAVSHGNGLLRLRGRHGADMAVVVFDARGQVVYRTRWERDRNTLIVDTSAWSSSVYVAKFVSGGETFVHRLCTVR